MKKERKLEKFVAVVVLIAVIACILIASTYAKYTTVTPTESDSAIVANWNVSVGHASTTFDIFDKSKIYDTKGVTNFTVDGTSDTDVKTGTTDGIIAPGTWGKFSYTVSNNSNVNATYAVDYTVDEKGVYLLWSTDGETWSNDLADVDATTIPMGTLNKKIDIYWKWAFDAEEDTDAKTAGQSDANDTALGEANDLAKPQITMSVTFTQVD